MNFTKSILIVALFFFTAMQSQSGPMVTTNIQTHLLNKYWSPNIGDQYEIVFFFTAHQVTLFVGNKKIGSEYFYITDNSGAIHPIFDKIKVGTTHSGNYLRTNSSYFIIEFFSDLQKFRWKRSFDPEGTWQTYSLLNNPYFNSSQGDAFTKNNCINGKLDSVVSYFVEEGKYTSYVSQADADTKALAEINEFGQQNANDIGSCDYRNTVRSHPFTKNDCSTSGVASVVIYTVGPGTYTSLISQAVADEKAQIDLTTNGQNYANLNGSCNYENTLKSAILTSNICSAGGVGLTITYTVDAGTYTSSISQADAEAKALEDIEIIGQATANSGGCTYKNTVKSFSFKRNNCIAPKVGTFETYTVVAGKYTSTISQADADAKAQAEITANGQNNANTKGSCL